MSDHEKKTIKKTLTWSKDKQQLFLELFEQHPCLYDTRNKFYSNRHARAEALDKVRVGMEIQNLTTEEVKTKINNIRSQVSQELRKQRVEHSGMSTEDKHEPVWWFEDAQFLVSHMKSRKGRDSLEDTPVEHTESIADEDEGSSVLSLNTIDEKRPRSPCEEVAPKRKKKQRVHDPPEENRDLTSTLKSLKETVNDLGREGLPEQEFGNYIAKELAGIDDAAILLDCKHAITNIIYEHKKKWLQKRAEISYEIL